MDQAAPRCEPSIADTMDKIMKLLEPSIKSKMVHTLYARTKSSPIGLNHVESDLRCSMDYADFERLHDAHGEVFLTHTNSAGIIVIAPPTIMVSDKAADKWLMSRIGSDEDISCVIGFEGPGTAQANKEATEFEARAAERGWVPLTKPKGNGSKGNDKWKGHYYIHLSGNGNMPLERGCGNDVQLTNAAIEYIDTADMPDVKAQLLYMMLCARDAHLLFKDPTQFPGAKETLRVICEARGLLDWSKFQVSPINEDGHLRCWSEHEMSAENFLCSTKSQSHAQKCHVDSVAAARLDFDPETKKLKTCAKPYGFMWGIARFNMLQGEGSIEDARHDLRLDENARLRKENAELRRQLAQLKGI
jgi:hypothetical protein